MKKRLIIILSVLVVGVLSVFTACGETTPPAPAELTRVEAAAAACTAAGNIAYWSDGTNFYRDEAGTEKLSAADIATPALGHAYGAPVWTWEADNSAATAVFTCSRGDDTLTLNAEITSASSATCDDAGALTYTATVVLGGITYASDNEVPAPALGHAYGAPVWTWAADNSAAVAVFTCATCRDEHKITVDAVYDTAASTVTCTAAGNAVYKAETTFDGTAYGDAKTVAADALGHVYGAPVWTWEADNSAATAVFTCARGDDTQTVNATVTSETTATADCVNPGSTKYTATATFNRQSYTDEKTVATPATGHTYGDPVWEWEADYSAATATFTCAQNDDTKTVSAEVTLDSSSTASCTAGGEAHYNASVTFGGQNYTDTKTATTEALGHDYEVTWTWNEDLASATAAYSCKRGDDTGELTDSEIEKAETPATCTAEGSVVYTASVTIGQKVFTETKTTTLPKLAHNNAEGAYISNGDAGHRYVCSQCGQNVASAHELVSAYRAPATGTEGTFYLKCELCDYETSAPGVYRDRTVTVNGVAYNPDTCYVAEHEGKGITYDAITQLFVVTLNAETIGQYAASGLTINGNDNDVSVNVETGVTLPSLTFTNGWRQLTVMGKGTLTINGEFKSEANPTTIRGNVNFGGAVNTGSQPLIIESGNVNVTASQSMGAYNLTVGKADGSTSPTLTITADGDVAGFASSGFNVLNLQFLSGTTVIENKQQKNCGISFNRDQGDDAVTVGANAALSIKNFGIGIAAWNDGAKNAKLTVDGTLIFRDCAQEYRDVTPVQSEA